MSEKKIGYMCKVDYDYELGVALGGNDIFSSIEDLKRHRTCVKECGIVKVGIEELEVVQKQDFSGYKGSVEDGQ